MYKYVIWSCYKQIQAPPHIICPGETHIWAGLDEIPVPYKIWTPVLSMSVFFFKKSTTDLLRVCPTVSLHHNHSSMALTGTEADYSVILETQHFPLGSSAFTLGPNADSGLLHQLTIIAPIQNFISLQIKIFMYEPVSVVCSWMHVCIMQIWWLYEGVYVWI